VKVKIIYTILGFSVLPVTQTKGEVLTVSFEDLIWDVSLNRKCFLLPLKNGNYKVGSTYIWDTDNTEITEIGKKNINLSSILNSPQNLF
jgi:glycine oxidase